MRSRAWWILLSVLVALAPGLVNVVLVELSPEFECDELGRPNQRLLKLWASSGAADLQHHQGNYHAQPFPMNAPTGVRIDLSAVVRRIEAGHRLGLLFCGDEFVNGRTARPQGGRMTLHGDAAAASSHVLLPIVEGTFGGEAPTLTYPPRPFVPAG